MCSMGAFLLSAGTIGNNSCNFKSLYPPSLDECHLYFSKSEKNASF